jgi:hypothetical protein
MEGTLGPFQKSDHICKPVLPIATESRRLFAPTPLTGGNAMSLREQLAAELQRLGTTTQPTTIQLTEPNVTLTLDLATIDQLAVAVHRFQITKLDLAQVALSRLQSIAEQLSKRLTYLLEPIRTIETDSAAGVVQLRSDPPTVAGNTRHYYELLVRLGGNFELVRYQKLPGDARQPVSAYLTLEVLYRLVNDVATAN